MSTSSFYAGMRNNCSINFGEFCTGKDNMYVVTPVEKLISVVP